MKLTIKGINTAISNIFNHSYGKCNVCGNRTIFLCRDISIARNDMICFFCASSSRNRHVASKIIDKLSKQITSIAEIPYVGNDIRIYNLATDDVFSNYLNNYQYYFSSDYIPDIPIGHKIGKNTYCQNVECLTFADDSFDLVLSEDVFEHVRDYKKGFSEVARVLKPGGFHIFTVPCFFDRKTLVRVDTTGTEDVHLLPPEYHGDSIRGQILAYRTFGFDIFEVSSNCGFHTEVFFSKYVDQKAGIFDSYVFVAHKLV